MHPSILDYKYDNHETSRAQHNFIWGPKINQGNCFENVFVVVKRCIVLDVAKKHILIGCEIACTGCLIVKRVKVNGSEGQKDQ